MKSILLMAAVALSGQVNDDRYPATTPVGTADAATAASPAAGDAAATAAETTPTDVAAQPATSSTLTLDASAAADYPVEGKSPELAPLPTQPVEAPPIAADAKPLSAAAAPPAAAAATPPVEGSVLAGNGPRPTEVMVTLLQAPETGQLTGVPLTLEDAVHDARTRQEQTTRAKAYWDLTANVGEYNLAMVERQQLVALRDGIAKPGAAWEEKLREYDTRAKLAMQAAQASQIQLQQLLGPASEGVRPLPADVPHCGRYNTEYAEIFGNRPNETAKQLDELMPLRYEQLRTQARAIVEAHDWLEKVSESRDPNTDGTGLLQAYDLLSLRRRAFMATARDYNHEIAAYIEQAAPAQIAPDRLVAMMIRTSAGEEKAPWEPSGVQQAGAVDPEKPAAAGDRTAAATSEADGAEVEGRVLRQVRRPFQRLFGREKSIVVERLKSVRNN